MDDCKSSRISARRRQTGGRAVRNDVRKVIPRRKVSTDGELYGGLSQTDGNPKAHRRRNFERDCVCDIGGGKLRDLIEQRRNALSADAIARKQVELVRELIQSNESFDAYNDKIVRGVIRSIRVMSDRTIFLTSKSGITVEEKVERYSHSDNSDENG